MAREITIKCDICKKPTKRIVAKLHYIPATERLVHSNYSHHADVGECCGEKIRRLFNFRPRVSAEEYQRQRKVS